MSQSDAQLTANNVAERQVFYQGKWDCDMDRDELLVLVGTLLASLAHSKRFILELTEPHTHGTVSDAVLAESRTG